MSSKGRSSEKGFPVGAPLPRPLFAALLLALFAVATEIPFFNDSLFNLNNRELTAGEFGADDAFPLTPEDISGVSLKEIDGLRAISHDYSVSPSGTKVPQSEDDDWFPDFSLNAETTAESALKNQAPANGPPQTVVNTATTPKRSVYSGFHSSQTDTVTASNPSAKPSRLASRSDSRSVYFRDDAASSQTVSEKSGENSLSDVSRQDSELSLTAPEAKISASSLPIPPAQDDSEFLAAPTGNIASEETDFPAPLSDLSPTSKQGPFGNTDRPLPEFAFPDENDSDQTAAPGNDVPVSVSSEKDPRHYESQDSFSELTMPELTKTPESSNFPTGNTADSNSSQTDASDPENRIIADIKCSAGMELPISRFNELIKTKIGNRFSQQILEEDKRRLLQTKQYVDVTVSTTLVPDENDKVIVNFDFTPRRQMKYIKVIGNRKMSKTEILEELNMKRGESRMDPYDVENGRLRIIELYKSKNLNEPFVDILKGDKPDDVGVVYLINEGIKQRVRDTTFVGNSVTSSGHLKHLVTAKPGFLYLIGGEFSRERLDEDVTKILEYYRNLGFFDARVDREFEVGSRFKFFNQENEWITVHYVINEGPRYKIRNFLFEGNRVLPTDELRSKLKIKTGSYFNHNELEADRIALKYAYGERGYVLAEVTPRQIFTEEDGVIDLRYDIKEDYRYRVKDIQIKYEGEESRTKASVVMNMLDFAPGQVLNDKKIKSSEISLKRSGYFNDKPSEGPLPTVSIIPETENLYFAEQTGNGLRPDERTARADVKDVKDVRKNSVSSQEPADDSDGDRSPDEKKRIDGLKKILGQTPDTDSRRLSVRIDNANRRPVIESHHVGRPDSLVGQSNTVLFNADGSPMTTDSRDKKDGQTAQTADTETVSAYDPGFRVSGMTNGDPLRSDATGADEYPERQDSVRGSDTGILAAGDAATIRGQSMEVPTGFGRTTTNASPANAWNGSNYIGYQETKPSATGVNAYSDTSMYNNGSYGAESSVLGSAADNAPPMTADASTSGVYSSTVVGNSPAMSEVPGFAGAGRDAVFPGTQEQQALDNQLWGNGPYSSLGGEEPIRDATVIASIMEGRTGMFQASIGVNSNYGLVGNVSFTERNFDIMKWPTAFWRSDGWADAFRGGGQIFRVEASPGKYYSRYSVSWDVPYIFDTDYNFGVTGLYADRYYDNWDDSRYGGELRFGRQWTPRFSTTLNGGAYNIKIHNPRVNYIPDINEVLGNNSQFLVGLNACYDTRNHPYLPSEGYVIDGSAEQIFGSYSYPRLSVDGRTYHTIHKRVDGSGRMVLGLRSAAGWTGNETPIYDRYFGGGYQNLRGFEYREVTPRYLNSNIGTGGFFEFYNSAELLVPVSGGDEFQLAFFLDTGVVSESIKRWGTYRVAPGIGMRIAIPMLGPAPLALDFAVPVVQDDSDEKEIFSFSITGSR